jgi:hypothetical protein
MPANSSTKPDGQTSQTSSPDETFEWPVEVVVCQIEVVIPRDLTALEWVLERILDEFREEPPTLAEAAEELGLGDTVMLGDSLRGLIEMGSAESRVPGHRPEDLPQVRLTSNGQKTLIAGRITPLPAHHGLELYFDALTGEHIPRRPQDVRHEPQRPIVPIAELPPLRESIGLDRVRELSAARGEPYHRGESQIRRIEIDPLKGRFVWAPVRIATGNKEDGRFEVTVEGLGSQQTDWLRRRNAARAAQSQSAAAATHWSTAEKNEKAGGQIRTTPASGRY